ncbi:AEC family transporter [Limosilactobacillus equigenerosi]|uniref:AEC family transporter n=1 Tax=Limosilactobacillus equigenerosi TaxID=417373 RepID=UPI000A8ED157|nr:AEC family transporter [Limosilactobacillus equigenerosi]
MSIFWTSIQSVLSIMIMMAIGYFCQGLGWFNDKFSSSLSDIIMKVALPCAIFYSMLSRFKLVDVVSLSSGIIYTILSIFIGYLISFVVVTFLHVPHGRKAIMMAGINITNTVFIGMPLNVALFGAVSLPYLIVYYIVNTIILWTFTVWTIAADDPKIRDGKNKVKISWRHMLPAPIWGFIVALPFLAFWLMLTLNYRRLLLQPLKISVAW